MSPKYRQNLARLTTKYLKHLQFAKAASHHTSKSYANDLGQFLQPLGIKTILPCAGGLHESFRDEADLTVKLLPVDVAEIRDLVRAAQELWRELSPASRNRKLAAVKSFLRWLHQEGYLDQELGAQVLAPKVPHRL